MSKIILYGVAMISVTASAVMAMDVFSTYQTLQRPTEPLAIKIDSKPVEPAGRKAKKNYSVIVSRNLFSSASLRSNGSPASRIKRPGKRRVPSKARQTLRPLTITLVGTTVGPEGVRYAILEEAGSRTHTIHRMGDRVQGAVIQGVERGEISLLRNGETIILRAFEKGSSAVSNPRGQNRRFSSNRSGSGSVKKLRRQLNRSKVRGTTESDFEFKKQIRVVAYQGKDGDSGIRIYPSGRGILVRQLGLRGGDIITQVDGTPISSGDELQSAILNFLGRNEAVMKISRRGKSYDIIYRIQ